MLPKSRHVNRVRSQKPRHVGELVRRLVELVCVMSFDPCDEGFASTGDTVVITAGVPFGTPGATNILRIAKVE